MKQNHIYYKDKITKIKQTMEWIEVIGWLGNILVITQFLQKDMMKLRIYGLLGGTVWLGYAILLGAISLVVLNIIIIGIQLYHIRKLYIQNNYE
jgi:hypothetical protein|tara:strand:- start:6 stop:287 length:282 start_codon:yes stop_codon:yes gene_type:complete